MRRGKRDNRSRRGIRFAKALLGILLAVLVFPAAASAADEESRVEQLERELDAIREELARLKAEMMAKKGGGERAEEESFADRFTELERMVEVLAQEVERKEVGASLFRKAEKGEHGLGVAASKVYQVNQGLSIGGYGEMLFESFSAERDDGAPAGRTDRLDFLRAILYVGYKFNDRWLFNSEIEVEHANTGQGGEVGAEFAYIDYLHRPEVNFRAGLLLVPMGFVNELHEPPLFLGARRSNVENSIIPTTWRENGFGVFGDVGPFTYRSYLLNGLEGAGFSSGGLRGGRQKGAQALAEDFAWVSRLDYTGTPGFLLGASAYFGDSGQGLTGTDGRPVDAGTTLFEAHLEWKKRGLEVRALGVTAEVDDVARLNGALGLAGNASVGEELQGFYAQVGYDLLATRPTGQRALIPYARWESFDTQHAVPAGFSKNPANDVDILTLGLAYKPLDQVIFKVDFQDFDNGADTGIDQFNVAIGYLF